MTPTTSVLATERAARTRKQNPATPIASTTNIRVAFSGRSKQETNKPAIDSSRWLIQVAQWSRCSILLWLHASELIDHPTGKAVLRE